MEKDGFFRQSKTGFKTDMTRGRRSEEETMEGAWLGRREYSIQRRISSVFF